jgi:hypothetical protein
VALVDRVRLHGPAWVVVESFGPDVPRVSVVWVELVDGHLVIVASEPKPVRRWLSAGCL